MLLHQKTMDSDLQNLINMQYIPYEKLRGKSVLITGACGMLAYYMTCTLMALNQAYDYRIKVMALVRNEQKARQKFSEFLDDAYFKLILQDVCADIVIDEPVHFIIHAAGNSSPFQILHHPVDIINANVIGTGNVLKLAMNNPTERILFLSTREVYGKVERLDYIKETDMGTLDPLELRSCYPESKRIAEQMMVSYRSQYHLPVVIARIAHAYGPAMSIYNDGRVMSDLICDRVENRDIVLKSTGEAVRAFCYVTDAVSALFTIMLLGSEAEAYNVANETEPVSILEVADMLADLYGTHDIQVLHQPQENMGGYCQYKRVGLCTEKLEKLGWKPQVKLREGLLRTVQSFNE